MNDHMETTNAVPQAGQTWQSYRDTLITDLRFRGVDSATVGQTIADMDAHLADSGESPEEAYGTAEEYAKEIAEATTADTDRRDGLMRFLPLVVPMLGGALLGGSAVRLGSGDSILFGIPAIAGVIVGLALMILWMGPILRSNVHDPRTGRIIGYSTRERALSTAILIVLVIAFALALGWVTGSGGPIDSW